MTQVLAHPYLNPAAALPLNSAAYEAMMLPLIAARRLRERAVEAALLEIGEKRRAGGSAAIAVAWKDQAKAEGECSLCTVTFHANRAHSLTRSP